MNYRWFYLLFVLLIQFSPTLVWGFEFHLIPSIAIKEEYNSNILLSPTDVKGDYITILSPGVEIVDRTERLNTDLLVRLDQLEYADNHYLSATNQTYSGTSRYLVTPLLGISAQAGYMKIANPTLDTGVPFVLTPGTIVTSAPTPSPSPPSPPTPVLPGMLGSPASPASSALFPIISIPWHRITSSLSADYQFTEKIQAVLSYGYGRDYYESPLIQDDISNNVDAGLVYDFGQYLPTVKGRVDMGYNYIHYPNSHNNSVSLSAGFSRDFNEVWSISADGGINRILSDVSTIQLVPFGTSSSFVAVKEQLNNANWGWLAGVSLNYKGEYLNGSLSLNRNFSVASGLNGAAESIAVMLTTQYRLTYELSFLLSAGYSSYKSSPSNYSSNLIDQETFSFSEGVRYEFSRDVAGEASYGYTRVQCPASNTIVINCPASNTKTTADRHLASITLYIQHSFLE
jgi:outer membrane scaffolding protein for murein synthesis (MipA/OmpV family)